MNEILSAIESWTLRKGSSLGEVDFFSGTSSLEDLRGISLERELTSKGNSSGSSYGGGGVGNSISGSMSHLGPGSQISGITGKGSMYESRKGIPILVIGTKADLTSHPVPHWSRSRRCSISEEYGGTSFDMVN